MTVREIGLLWLPVRWGLVVVALAGCGRWGFGSPDAASSDGDAAGGGDAPIDPIDAPPGTVVATFGETPGATYSSVTSDTFMSNDVQEVTLNYGASTSFGIESGQKRALLRFAVSAIAPGKMIAAARLHLTVTQAGTTMPTISIQPVTEAWTEGTLNGTAGVANWTQRTSTQSWTTAGASSPGSAGAQIASFQVTSTGLLGVDLPAATVQSWVDTPASNDGLVMSTVSTNADLSFASSNSTTATERPELVVTYYP